MNGNYIDKKEIKLIALIYKSKDCFDAKNLQILSFGFRETTHCKNTLKA